MNENIKLHNGDCLEIMKTELAHTVIISKKLREKKRSIKWISYKIWQTERKQNEGRSEKKKKISCINTYQQSIVLSNYRFTITSGP